VQTSRGTSPNEPNPKTQKKRHLVGGENKVLLQEHRWVTSMNVFSLSLSPEADSVKATVMRNNAEAHPVCRGCPGRLGNKMLILSPGQAMKAPAAAHAPVGVLIRIAFKAFQDVVGGVTMLLGALSSRHRANA
jgi:hypothetical protein